MGRTRKGIASHGLSKTKLYYVWLNMKSRCYYKGNKRFKRYGGRGVIICDEWLNNPLTFMDWANENGYKEGLQIDRIDNDGDYEPSNCRFVTNAENNHNKNDNKLNWRKVRAIRMIKKNCPYLTQKKAARMFGLHATYIGRIWNNKSWKE